MSWLIDAADLLAEPDPGPTPWLVDGLIVDQALVAAVGRWKTTKSYGFLDVSISIATGRPAFGTFAIPNPGPVVFVNEESGRAALWRRLDALCRGRAIPPDELRGKLKVAANARVKLDDPAWQEQLLTIGTELRPRLFVFDPLARMKAPGREENAQADMAHLIEFLRELREASGAAVAFVHHTGHVGGHMRGSSDLESVWETRLTWTRDDAGVTVTSEHREAEAGPPIRYRLDWDSLTRTMRLQADVQPGLPSLAERLLESLRTAGPGSTKELARRVNTRVSDVLRTLEQLEQGGYSASAFSKGVGNGHGNVHRGRSGRRDRAGRPIRDNVWYLSEQAASWPFPDAGTPGNGHEPGIRGSVGGPPSLEGTPREQPPQRTGNGRLLPGDHGYLNQLLADIETGQITPAETRQLELAHTLIEKARA